jgi:phosphatidylinositol alpha-1,6-mannosyltransferase
VTLRPKLLTITPDFPPSLGGIQLYLHRLLEHLPEWEHRVVARGATGPPPSFDVSRTRTQTGVISNLELNVRALSGGLSWRPDLVLCGHVVAAPAARALRMSRRVPSVLVAYADELTHRPRLTRTAITTAISTIAISRYTAELVQPYDSRASVHMIPPGFDPPDVSPRRVGRPTMLTVARLTDRYKGHDVVLEALPAIRAAVPEVRWVVVGDGPLKGELEQRARDLGVADAVEFLGRVDDETRDRLLSEAWVFVMPSRLPERGAGGEGFGIVYLEAAAAGLPVVAGGVAGALDAVDDGVTGTLVDPTDPAALNQAVSALLGDPERAAAMGQAGTRWATQFSWGRMATEVDAVLRGALPRGSRP